MKLVVAYIKPFKLEDVKTQLKSIGVAGMSVSDVRGFGRQASRAPWAGAQQRFDGWLR